MKSILVAATWFNGRIMAAVRLKHTTQKEPAEDNSYSNVYFFTKLSKINILWAQREELKNLIGGLVLKETHHLPSQWLKTDHERSLSINLSRKLILSVDGFPEFPYSFFLLLWKGNLFNKSWSCKLPERIGISSCSSLHTSPTLNDFFSSSDSTFVNKNPSLGIWI